MGSKLLAFLLMTSAAFGQAVCVTNRTHVGLPLGPLLNPITYMQRGDELRHNNYAFDGSGPVDLVASFVKYEIVSGPTMSISRTNVTYTATILGSGLTQVIITPTIPAGQYYTKFIQYQANNSNYLRTLSWDTLIVTNPPSAGGGSLGNLTVQWEIQGDGDLAPDATDRTIVPHTDGGSDLGRSDERFRTLHAITARVDRLYVAGDADVGGTLSALDNSRVLRVGETNEVILTGTQVRVRYPVDPPDATSKEYVDAVAGSAANIGVQLTTNVSGSVGYTNWAGLFIPLRDQTIPEPNPIFIDTFDDMSLWTSNLNVAGSAWQYGTTNGKGWVVGPNETGTGRFFHYVTNGITAGEPRRFSLRIEQGLHLSQLANCWYLYGISWMGSGLTNNVFLSSSLNGPEIIETYLFGLAYTYAHDLRGIAPYNAGNTASRYLYTLPFTPPFIMYWDHDGATTARAYISTVPGGSPILFYRATNVAALVGFSIFAQVAAGVTAGTNTGAFVFDNFTIGEGLWSDAW